MKRWLFRLTSLLIAIAAAGSVYWAVTNRNEILDSYYLKKYTPPTQVASLASQASLTDEGTKLFYRAQPQINANRQELATNCHIQDNKTIELGCYTSTGASFISSGKIYILDIQQEDIEDEMVVTAAHETLHAGYARLSKKEKADVDAQLEQAAAKITDQGLKDRLAQYDISEPGQRDNELHSILGSEYSDLPPALEQHYSRYFTNRTLVVAYSDEFKRTYDGLHTQITQLNDQITATKAKMKKYEAAGQISSYNALVPQVNKDITTYNQEVEQYNKYSSLLLGEQQTAAKR